MAGEGFVPVVIDGSKVAASNAGMGAGPLSALITAGINLGRTGDVFGGLFGTPKRYDPIGNNFQGISGMLKQMGAQAPTSGSLDDLFNAYNEWYSKTNDFNNPNSTLPQAVYDPYTSSLTNPASTPGYSDQQYRNDPNYRAVENYYNNIMQTGTKGGLAGGYSQIAGTSGSPGTQTNPWSYSKHGVPPTGRTMWFENYGYGQAQQQNSPGAFGKNLGFKPMSIPRAPEPVQPQITPEQLNELDRLFQEFQKSQTAQQPTPSTPQVAPEPVIEQPASQPEAPSPISELFQTPEPVQAPTAEPVQEPQPITPEVVPPIAPEIPQAPLDQIFQQPEPEPVAPTLPEQAPQIQPEIPQAPPAQAPSFEPPLQQEPPMQVPEPPAVPQAPSFSEIFQSPETPIPAPIETPAPPQETPQAPAFPDLFAPVQSIPEAPSLVTTPPQFPDAGPAQFPPTQGQTPLPNQGQIEPDQGLKEKDKKELPDLPDQQQQQPMDFMFPDFPQQDFQSGSGQSGQFSENSAYGGNQMSPVIPGLSGQSTQAFGQQSGGMQQQPEMGQPLGMNDLWANFLRF